MAHHQPAASTRSTLRRLIGPKPGADLLRIGGVLLAKSLLLLTFAQDDPFELAGEQGCAVINFIFRGTGAAILLGIVWAFALWTLFTQRGAIWGLGIAIVVSLIIQFAPAFIGFFAPDVEGTCLA